MKIALLNDTHFGARNDSQLFLEYFLSFFENEFFPYLKENNIDTIIHLGDFLDRRKFVNFYVLSQVRSRFFNYIKENNIEMHMIIGNHDTYYKSTNEVNSAKELFFEYDNFHLYETPQTIELNNVKFAMVPWICDKNHDETMNYIKSVSADVLCGHLELQGYEVMRGVKHIGGMSDEGLEKFEYVLTGHFHNKTTNKNVYYLGTQYEITFADSGDMKGFHVFDTTNRTLNFVENTNKMFYTIKDTDEITDFSVFKDKFVRFLVTEKYRNKTTDFIINKIEDSNPYDFSIIEKNVEEDDDTIVDLSKDTITIINEEIEELELDLDKNKLKKITNEIYMEALSL